MLAFITGGSRGLGRAMVERLAEDGFDIAFTSQASNQAVDEVVDAVKSIGRKVFYSPCDISELSATKVLAQGIVAELGTPDVVVNNAGISIDSPVVKMSEEDWSSVLATNLTGTFNICRSFSFEMLKNQQGSIINISSGVAIHGGAGISNYAASKAGIVGFSQSLAKELGPFGIRVNTIMPGYIDCGLFEKLTQSQKDWVLKHIPLGRLGCANEVADLVSFLASEKSSYINKAVIPIDGGIGL